MFARKINSMRSRSACLLLVTAAAIGISLGDFVEEPDLVGKITEALVASKVDQLTPHTIRNGGNLYSYHLKAVSYLGPIERGAERFILATAFFIRSSAKVSGHPPARGHGFLLCLSPDFKLTSYCRLHYPPDVYLSGTELRRQQEVIGSFAVSDLQRARGFLVDGDDILPYPFSDKHSDPMEVKPNGERAGAWQPADRPESKSEGGDKTQPNADGRSR